MDNVENTPVTTDRTAELQQQVESLRQLVGSVLIIVFILSGALNIYFWRQLRAVNSELKPLKAQSVQIQAEMTKVNAAAGELVRKLLDYTKTHPEFAPILQKYNIREAPPTNAPAAATTAPLPPPPAKKK